MKRPRKPAFSARDNQSASQAAEAANDAETGQMTALTGAKNFPGKAKIVPENPKALFLPYQTQWVLDGTKMKLMEKSRQIGLTWSTGYRAVRECGVKGRKYDTWVSSRDEGQAALFLQDARQWAELLQPGAKDLGCQLYEDGKGKPFKAFEMQFSNGRILHSMSSNPDAQAGKRGTRILDEFALHPNPRLLYSIAYPGITWGGNMEIISTHRGNLNFFAELVREIKDKGNPKKISLHTVTLTDALEQGFLYKLQKKLYESDPSDPILEMDEAEYFDMVRSKCADEETFLQEYMCVPADDRSTFLDWDLIAGAEYGPHESWQLNVDAPGGDLYVGVDVGRRHDLTVIWMLEKLSDHYFTRKVIELKNARFAEQELLLWELLGNRRVRRCCMDATGLGMQLAERAQERFGKYRVEAVNFTAAVKEELAYPVRSLMEERALKIPNSREIRQDLRGIKKEYTKSGNIRFTADTGPDGHSDRFWALALAIHAGKTPQVTTLPPMRTKIWMPGAGVRTVE